MKNKIYYKIKSNDCDTWEIVSTTNRSGDTHELFSEAKKELIEIFKAAIQAEKEAMYVVEDLKLKDIKPE